MIRTNELAWRPCFIHNANVTAYGKQIITILPEIAVRHHKYDRFDRVTRQIVSHLHQLPDGPG